MNKTDIAFIINTIGKNSDLWKMFFTQNDKHIDDDLFDNKYVFTNEVNDDIPSAYKTVLYDEEKLYRDQFLAGIREVPEEFCVYVSEDYILHNDVLTDEILTYRKILDDHPEISFIRFMKGGLIDADFPPFDTSRSENVYQLFGYLPYFYTNQAALWRTRDLERIHAEGPNLHIGGLDYENQFETQATITCRKIGTRGLYCYHGEKKRGMYHYDCSVWPHISTALVKGQWNLSEYPTELHSLLQEYEIDPTKRGIV